MTTEARAAWHECEAITEAWSFLSRGRRWRALAGLGETWLADGDFDAAVPFLRQAQAVATTIGAEAAWADACGRLLATYGRDAGDLARVCGPHGDQEAG